MAKSSKVQTKTKPQAEPRSPAKPNSATNSAIQQQRRIQRQVARSDAKPAEAKSGAMQAGARRYPEPPFRKQHQAPPNEANPSSRHQKSQSTRLPTLGRILGRKKGFGAPSPGHPEHAIRSKVNAQVGGVQFTAIY